MKEKAKLKLEDIKVESFVTSLNEKDSDKILAGCLNTSPTSGPATAEICQNTGCCPTYNTCTASNDATCGPLAC
jgi:hypothetical protein